MDRPDSNHSNLEFLYAFLDRHEIAWETVEHIPTMTIKDTYALTLPDPVCKNLFLKDRRKKLWLLVALPETKIHLKKVAQEIDAPELRFADVELLYETLGVKPGAVTLFGILNDTNKSVTVLLDAGIFEHERVGFHPFHNGATTFIRTKDIHPFIKACSSSKREIEFYET